MCSDKSGDWSVVTKPTIGLLNRIKKEEQEHTNMKGTIELQCFTGILKCKKYTSVEGRKRRAECRKNKEKVHFKKI